MSRVLLCLVSCLSLAASSAAQQATRDGGAERVEPAPAAAVGDDTSPDLPVTPRASAEPTDGAATSDAPARDPFSATPVMVDRAQSGGIGFTPASARDAPVITLRGYAEAGGQALALLEVEGHGVFVVREGDTISLQSRGDVGVLAIRAVKNRTVSLEVGSAGRALLVR